MLNHSNRTHRWALYLVQDGERKLLGRYNAYEDAQWNYEQRKQGIADDEKLKIEIESIGTGAESPRQQA